MVNNELLLKTSEAALLRLQKLLRQQVSTDRSIVEEFLQERREEAQRDD